MFPGFSNTLIIVPQRLFAADMRETMMVCGTLGCSKIGWRPPVTWSRDQAFFFDLKSKFFDLRFQKISTWKFRFFENPDFEKCWLKVEISQVKIEDDRKFNDENRKEITSEKHHSEKIRLRRYNRINFWQEWLIQTEIIREISGKK